MGQLRAAQESGQPLSNPSVLPTALTDMASSFGTAFVVATILVALCLVPAVLLPRRRPAATQPEGATAGTLVH